MRKPEPYETYRGVSVFLYQEVGSKPGEWGASIQWQKRLIDVKMKGGECPTSENILTAAHRLIDLMKQCRDHKPD